jgi:hypothetical protein
MRSKAARKQSRNTFGPLLAVPTPICSDGMSFGQGNQANSRSLSYERTLYYLVYYKPSPKYNGDGTTFAQWEDSSK